MASAWLMHHSAKPARLAFHAVDGLSSAHRSNCKAASLSSVAERGPTSQALSFLSMQLCPLSTIARISLAATLFGTALTTLADSALSPVSYTHLTLPTIAKV